MQGLSPSNIDFLSLVACLKQTEIHVSTPSCYKVIANQTNMSVLYKWLGMSMNEEYREQPDNIASEDEVFSPALDRDSFCEPCQEKLEDTMLENTRLRHQLQERDEQLARLRKRLENMVVDTDATKTEQSVAAMLQDLNRTQHAIHERRRAAERFAGLNMQDRLLKGKSRSRSRSPTSAIRAGSVLVSASHRRKAIHKEARASIKKDPMKKQSTTNKSHKKTSSSASRSHKARSRRF